MKASAIIAYFDSKEKDYHSLFTYMFFRYGEPQRNDYIFSWRLGSVIDILFHIETKAVSLYFYDTSKDAVLFAKETIDSIFSTPINIENTLFYSNGNIEYNESADIDSIDYFWGNYEHETFVNFLHKKINYDKGKGIKRNYLLKFGRGYGLMQLFENTLLDASRYVINGNEIDFEYVNYDSMEDRYMAIFPKLIYNLVLGWHFTGYWFVLPLGKDTFLVINPLFDSYNVSVCYVWTLLQKQELILSVFMERTIPYFTMIENDDNNSNTYQVIDGKQRLSALFDFLDNKFSVPLFGSGYFFKDLPKDYQMELNTLPIKFYVFYETDSSRISDIEKINIFTFVNFAGTQQDKQHINNLQSKIESYTQITNLIQ